jgi:hypothetical protein
MQRKIADVFFLAPPHGESILKADRDSLRCIGDVRAMKDEQLMAITSLNFGGVLCVTIALIVCDADRSRQSSSANDDNDGVAGCYRIVES